MTTALATPLLSSGEQITDGNREQWLAARRQGIGASEAAAAVGICPYRSPLELYLRKIGDLPEVEQTEAMRMGLLMEPVILQLYRERVAGQSDVSRYATQQFMRSEQFPWMSATLDAVRDDNRPVELKSVGWRMAHHWGEEGTDEIPDYYLCQIHHQIAVTGEDSVDVAALIGGQDFRVYTVHRDAEMLDRLVALEAAFWGRVQRREPPPVDPARDGRLMACLYPEAEGTVDLGPEAVLDALTYEELGDEIRSLERRRTGAKVRLLDALGGAALGHLPDGRTVTRKVISVAERTQTVKAHTYARLTTKKGRNGDGQE